MSVAREHRRRPPEELEKLSEAEFERYLLRLEEADDPDAPGELQEASPAEVEDLIESLNRSRPMVIDLGGSVEDIADAILAGVREDLAKQDLTLEEMADWTDETHPDPNHDANERANEEYAKKHGIKLGR